MLVFDRDLVGKRESVTEQILLLNPDQTPLINLVGFSEPAVATTYVWYEDKMFATKSKVSEAAAVDATTIQVQDVEPFRPEQIVQVGDEMILVTAVDTVNHTLQVQRGYGGTTPEAIAENAEIEVMFDRNPEGADAKEARYKARTKCLNVTQIFSDTVSITGTAQAVAQYGIADMYEYEKAKKQLELALQLEKALINGVMMDDGTVRQMRGIRSFIQTNVTDAAGAPITADMITDAAQKIYEAGGFIRGANYVIMAGTKQRRAISKLNSEKVTITQMDTTRGNRVDAIVTDFGTLPILLNGNLKHDEIFILDANRIKLRPLQGRDFSHTFLGITGDRVEGMVVGEYTLEFRQEAAHARIKGLV